MQGNRTTRQSKNLLVSDSMQKTTKSLWFHGMWTARNKVSALSRVGWSTESLMKRIFKRIWEISRGETTAALRDSQIVADLPLPLTPHTAPRPQEGKRRDVLSSEVGQGGFTDGPGECGQDLTRKLAESRWGVRRAGRRSLRFKNKHKPQNKHC